MGRLTPDEARGLLGAYALGAVDDDERAEVAELLLADSDARAELHTLQLGVAWLDHASTGAPRHVWRAIADEIADEVAASPAGSGAPGFAPVVDLAARRRRRVRVLSAAAALLVAAVVALGVVATRSDDAPPTVAALAADARSRSGTEVAALRTGEGDRAGTVVVAEDGTAYLVWSRRPSAASDGTFQLWELTPTGPRSAGLLGADARDTAFRVGPDATAVAVTREPRGGSPAPTGTPVVVASLS